MSQNKAPAKKHDKFKGKPDGRIGRLDNHTLGYYRRVSDTLQEGFENAEDKDLMLSNVFKQLCTEAISVSQNQTVSNIVEGLLRDATPPQLAQFMAAFATDWEKVATDRFASHVTQTLLLSIGPYLNKPRELQYESEDETKPPRKAKEMFVDLYMWLMGNLAVYMQHMYASHILRVVMEILAGIRVGESVVSSKMARKNVQQQGQVHESQLIEDRPAEFEQLLKDMVDKILGFQMLRAHAENSLSNPVLQTILLILKSHDPKILKSACKTVISSIGMFEIKDSSSLGFMTHEIGSRLVELVLTVIPDKMFTRILDNDLKPYLSDMAVHPSANFVLQRLITSTRTPDQFELVFAALQDHIEDILAYNHMGVIQKLAEMSLKHGTMQQKLVKGIMKAFHCYEPEERRMKFATLLAALTTYEVFYKTDAEDKEGSDDSDSDDDEDEEMSLPTLKEVNIHGSILLQSFLQFANPRLVVSSLLDMQPTELRTMACDPRGSHVIDAFIKSPAVGEKSVTQLLKAFKGVYADLACHKHGSRSLETLWQHAPLQIRVTIAEELVKTQDKIRSDQFGRFVWRSCALGHFNTRRADWNDIQNGQMRKRKLFKEFLDTPVNDANAPSEQKKQKKTKRKHDSDSEEEKNTLKLESDDETSGTQLSAISSPATGKSKKKKKKKDRKD